MTDNCKMHDDLQYDAFLSIVVILMTIFMTICWGHLMSPDAAYKWWLQKHCVTMATNAIFICCVHWCHRQI